MRGFITVIGSIVAIMVIVFIFRSHDLDTQRRDEGDRISARMTAVPSPDRALSPVLSSEEIDGILASPVWGEPLSPENASKVFRHPMTPEQARILLERTREEIMDIQKRSIISSMIMAALCENGFAAEAWDLVDDHPGSARTLEIGTIFLKDSSSMESLIERLEALVDSSERYQALHGMLMARPKEMANLDFGGIPIDSSYEKGGIAASILAAINRSSTAYGDSADAEPLLRKSVDLVREGKLEPNHLVMILKGDATNDAFQQWSVISDLNDKIETKDFERIRSSVVSNMVKADAGRAMTLLGSDPDTKYSYPLLREAIYTMYEVDESHANEWVATRLPDLDPETGQRVIASLTQVSIRNGEFDTARQWANRITNTTIRNQILDQIRTTQTPKPPVGN